MYRYVDSITCVRRTSIAGLGTARHGCMGMFCECSRYFCLLYGGMGTEREGDARRERNVLAEWDRNLCVAVCGWDGSVWEAVSLDGTKAGEESR